MIGGSRDIVIVTGMTNLSETKKTIDRDLFKTFKIIRIGSKLLENDAFKVGSTIAADLSYMHLFTKNPRFVEATY